MEGRAFTREILQALSAPFSADDLEFLPRATSNGKALALPYIDARAVMNRLDLVVGPDGWNFDFDPLATDGKMVRGRLTVLGVTKCDAGQAGDEDEPLKSAVSDALKRCAVHFGIARYLYYLPRAWAPYDAGKKRWTETPRIDPAALDQALRRCNVFSEGAREYSAPSTPSRSWQPSAERAASFSAATVAGNPPESPGDRAAAGGLFAGASPAPERRAIPEARSRTGRPLAVGRASDLLCSGAQCGKALTQGQHDISMRSFGQALCPACQKARQKTA